ncbi:hypothetical protein [uncultured Microscilla sp.]|uniref:hypothetical protein n=1 Tax=uncultured Microscilla sp. TaxID=432653 RepID=UPI00261CBCA7|nr:hypothetical protein [uncultured Microscilla sp.]
MSYQKDIESLSVADYQLPQRNKNNYISFIKGYLLGKNDKDFEEQVSLYLNRVHQINIEHNTWIEQLDHYAFKQNESFNLVDGLVNVLDELDHFRGVLKHERQEIRDNFTILDEHKGIEQGQGKLKDGTIVKVGDLIQLADKIGEDYKACRFYDASLRAPSWDLLYPSQKDFEEVYFYADSEDNFITNFGRVRRLFSDTISKVKAISINDGCLIVYTDIFKINMENALQKEEVFIVDSQNREKILDLARVSEEFQYYSMGILTAQELFNRDVFLRLPLSNKKWYKYHQSINGSWHKNNEIS